MYGFLRFLFWLSTASILTACMGSPEDIGGFSGTMPKAPPDCAFNDPNRHTNPLCSPETPTTPIAVPEFTISSGVHLASSAGLKIVARSAETSFVTPQKITSESLVVRVGINGQSFDADSN